MITGKPVDEKFWKALCSMFPNDNAHNMPWRLLSKHNIQWTRPSKGQYKITVDKAKCRAVMFYPKSARIVIQANGVNKATTFTSSDPDELMQKIRTYL